MAIAVEQTDLTGNPPVIASGNLGQRAAQGASDGFWLDGQVILCACPDCGAPMSVRLWLLMAECWRCGTRIELTEEQEREVEMLLAEAAVPPPSQQPRPNLAPERFDGIHVTETQAPSLVPDGGRFDWPRRLLDATPAWLVSMLVHLILFLLLALMTMEPPSEPGPFITLSAVLSRRVREGGDAMQIRPQDRAEFDLPLPTRANLDDPRQRKLLLAAAQDAGELRLDDDSANLPNLAAVKNRLGQADGLHLALAARDPRLRAEMVTLEGGTTLTEAAVARGLRWLANHQNSDGSWSLAGFRHAGGCNCRGDGTIVTKAPGTALALLPFLGAGQTHLAGRYQGTVSRGLRWLIEHQREDGDLRFDATNSEGMYTHGQAAIVLCEAFAMTGDEALRRPAQRAVDFIAKAQYSDGGWRYRPGPKSSRGDTSVVGWQLMALQSARAGGLATRDDTWELADVFLDGVQRQDGARYSYQPGERPTAAMTAEALLCRIYLGWKQERQALVRGARWLVEEHPPSARSPNIYYWYYATQVLHHRGGPEWDEWNQQMRDILVRAQETQGHLAGSWGPKGEHSSEGGRIYMTALAICTLEVYYRHLPIFRRIEIE